MNPRLSNLPGIQSFPHAYIDVICTRGSEATEDALAKFIVSNRVHGTTEMLLNRTNSVSSAFIDDGQNAKLRVATSNASHIPMRFFSSRDAEQNTREQIDRIRSHPWIAKDILVRRFIFDVEKGLPLEARPVALHTAA